MTTKVEVFKTNVEKVRQSKMLSKQLLEYFPEAKINFDLRDCDKILRVEGKLDRTEKIIEVLHSKGYQCDVLI